MDQQRADRAVLRVDAASTARRRLRIRMPGLARSDGEPESLPTVVARRGQTDDQSTQQILIDYGIDIAGEASLVSDALGHILWCNHRFTEITGFTIDQLFGGSCSVLQGTDTDAATVAEIQRTLAARRTFRGRILNYRKDGTPFWNHLRISPVFDEAGAVTNFVSVQRDVTSSVERENHFNEFRRGGFDSRDVGSS